MCEITKLTKKIEEFRAEVAKSLESDPYEVFYEKNKALDKLIEDYLDEVEKSSTNLHTSAPQSTTNE